MKTVVIGIDPSSRKIAATITVDDDETGPVVRIYNLPPGKPTEACLISFVRVRAMVKEFSGPDRKVYVFIEEPVLGRGGARATIPQSKTHGAMLAGASSVSGTYVQGVNNQRAKKQIVGIGNASKDQIKYWCFKCWPALYDLADGDQDIMDSAMINRYGVNLIRLKNHIVSVKKHRRILKRG